MSAIVFQNADSAYLSWVSNHASGFVLNTYSQPSSDYLVLHTLKCKSITKPKEKAHLNCFTGNAYLKVCAHEVDDLSDWIFEQGFENFTSYCSRCKPGENFYRRFNWTRDELILALELYHSSPAARNNVNHPSVVELSETLQSLPIHPTQGRSPNFRNPNGVSMKMGNFRVCDPKYAGTGLQQGAKSEQIIWNEFSGDIPKLIQTALIIRQSYSFLKTQGLSNLSDEDGAEEGGIILVMHRRYERDYKIIKKKKKIVFEKNMSLNCEVCDFDFANVYGDLGSQFAECHHTKPVANMKPGDKTKLEDLSIVCANCHRMLHRGRDLLSISSLKSLIIEEMELNAIRKSFMT